MPPEMTEMPAPSRRTVSFNTSVDMLLIPEVKEIKAAKLDLWWEGTDFFSFKQSAQSEIKLYALYENVNCREAKKMLYQPGQEDVDVDEEETFEPVLMCASQASLFRHKDSLSSLPLLSGEEDPALMCASQASLFRHKDSLSSLSLLSGEEDPDERCAVAVPLNPVTEHVVAHIESDEIDDEDRYLNFCVRSKEFHPLSTKERRSRCRQLGPSAAVIFGFMSFTIPLIGYYLMQYVS
jgi:hypothetical protein